MKYESQYGTTYELAFYKSRYVADDSLFIEAWCNEEGEDCWEPYAPLTVCLYEKPADGCSFLDTNNTRHLIDTLYVLGAFEYTGRMVPSGFCEYPEARWNPEWLKKNVHDFGEDE